MGFQKYRIECTMVAVMEAKESPYAIANEVLEQGSLKVEMHTERKTRTKEIADCRFYTVRG